jgi:hypothetical protein
VAGSPPLVPRCHRCRGGGPPVAVVVAVLVGRWCRAAVGAPAAVTVAGGGWCLQLPWSPQWWWVGRRRHCGGPRCRHHRRWWVVPPIAVVVMVVGRCLLMPSSLWCPHSGGPVGGASSLVASGSEQNGVGRGTHLLPPVPLLWWSRW